MSPLLLGFRFFLQIGLFLINSLPDSFNFLLPSDIIPSAAFLLQGLAFFLPISTLAVILVIKFSIHNFRLVLAIIKFIIQFIPGL